MLPWMLKFFGLNFLIKPLHATGLLIYPWENQKTRGFFDVFRDYRKRPVVWNGLNSSKPKDLQVLFFLLISTTVHKIFETNSSFHVKQCTTGKLQFVFFSSFLLVFTNFSFWEWDWALAYNYMKFWDFPDIS